MKLRHRIICWLSFGDLIFINAEMNSGGEIRPRNAGPILLHRLDLWRWDKPYILALTDRWCDAALWFRAYGKQCTYIENCTFNRLDPIKEAARNRPLPLSKEDGKHE